MSLEAKEILEYLGVESVESIDDFRNKFAPAYIKRSLVKDDKELVSSIVGKLTGSIRVGLLSDLKKVGIELTEDETKDQKIEKIAELGISKLAGHYQGQIESLKKVPAESKEWQERLDKQARELADTKALLEHTKEKYKQDKDAWNGEKKGIQRQSILNEEYKKIKWKTGVKEIEKKGFFSLLADKYKMELGDSGQLELFGLDGHKIPNPKKNGEFKGVAEAIEEEGVAAGIWETNPVAERGRPQVPRHHQQQPNQPGPIAHPALSGRERRLSPAAVANEGRQ